MTQQLGFLEVHGPYALRVMRESLQGMERNRAQTPEQVLWTDNLNFESFAITARALVEFLRIHKDERNFHFTDFVGITSNFVKDGPIDMLFTKTIRLAIHFGKERTTPEDRLDLEHDCEDLADWIENEMTRFLAALNGDQLAQWDVKKIGEQRVVMSAAPDANAVNHHIG